ncbi:MerR family transcriptional regulator [Plantactinospora sonchi]|uniref:MerR family transcriptional regulator n=1 Tax=Plantactinospora sonchi TaxID=1544735 RepID=A0ABU7RL84_9ACTN
MSRSEDRLRPVDLARLVNVSTQQIRNYVDTGILPPAPRTSSGYRSLTDRHRRALLAYRAMASGYGWGAARAVMQAIHGGELPRAFALLDAGHAAQHEERRLLRETGEALARIAGQSTEARRAGQAGARAGQAGTRAVDPAARAVDAGPRAGDAGARAGEGGLRIGELARLLGIRTSALRVWESAGLLTPSRERGTRYRRFGPDDVRDARMIRMLRQGRYPLPQVRAIMDGLRRTGSTDALRAVVMQRDAELTRRAGAMLEGASRLHDYLTAHPPDGPAPDAAAADVPSDGSATPGQGGTG